MMGSDRRVIVVPGATARQGSAVIRHLTWAVWQVRTLPRITGAVSFKRADYQPCWEPTS